MPQIPLPKGIKGIRDVPKSQEHLINLMLCNEAIIRTPCIGSFATPTGTCRGACTWYVDNRAYFVCGTNLLRVNVDGSTTSLGTIAGTADVFFSQGQINLVIGVKGGNGYRYNASEGLLQITDADYLPSVSGDFIDGRHVFIPADGSPAFYSDVDNAGSIEPLSFFDAEEVPDNNKAVINLNNQLCVLGEQVSEFFRTNVDPDVVFTRRDGARLDVGYISALTRYNDAAAFIGRRRDEGAKFFMIGAGQVQEFSTPAICELINEEYTLAELEACNVVRYEWKGYEVLAFNLARHTLSFCNGEWFYQDSNLDGTKQGPWRAKGVCNAYGKFLVGDSLEAKIGHLGDYQTEYGNDVEFEIRTFARGERESYFQMSALTLDCLTGQKLTTETISLSISKNGYLWSDWHPRSLRTTGQYDQLVKWQPPGGFGVTENYLGIKLRSTADVRFSLEALEYS